MKIQILATPRSGSTSISKLIWSHLKEFNYSFFMEPFNLQIHSKRNINESWFESYEIVENLDNLLVKNILLSRSQEYPIKQFNSNEEHIQYTSTFFDKIIVLDRKDKKAQSESFVINETESRLRGIDWHQPKIYRTDNIDIKQYNDIFDMLKESETILYDFSKKHNYPLFYYEDIFIDYNMDELKRLFDYINIEMKMILINEFVLNKERRVRIDPVKVNKLL
jgi:hypothetical protein